VIHVSSFIHSARRGKFEDILAHILDLCFAPNNVLRSTAVNVLSYANYDDDIRLAAARPPDPRRDLLN
jgi:hypothetical protein